MRSAHKTSSWEPAEALAKAGVSKDGGKLHVPASSLGARAWRDVVEPIAFDHFIRPEIDRDFHRGGLPGKAFLELDFRPVFLLARKTDSEAAGRRRATRRID